MSLTILFLVVLYLSNICQCLIEPFIDPQGEVDVLALAKQVANLTSQIADLQSQEDQNVMFTVHMRADHFFVTTNGQVFKFDQVITNVGGGYDVGSGNFTAPVSGNYLFILQIMISPGNELEVSISYQGNIQTTLYAWQDQQHDMSTVTSVVHLNQGEEVHVLRTWGVGKGDIRGGLWSQFSGTLLKSDM